MKLQVLGCAGGESPDHRATAFLLNDRLLVDAGSVMQGMSIEAQKHIDAVLVTHAHLDHIKDLGFILDNTFSSRSTPLRLAAPASVIQDLKQHIFNWVIWPDFSVLPEPEQAVMTWLPFEHPINLNGLTITSCAVNHPGNAFGYLIEDAAEDVSILISGDTASTEAIWELAFTQKNLAAIFVDVAFPDRLENLALRAGHYTPRSFARQMESFPRTDLPFYVYHLKPAYHDEVVRDLLALENNRLQLLADDEVYQFQSC